MYAGVKKWEDIFPYEIKEFVNIARFRKAKGFLEEAYCILGFNLSSFFLLQRLTNLSTSTFLSKI